MTGFADDKAKAKVIDWAKEQILSAILEKVPIYGRMNESCRSP